ncbi:MAG: signal peptidase I [Erythrobacter sp.]
MDEKTEDTNAPMNNDAVAGASASPAATAAATPATTEEPQEESWGSFALFVLKLALAVLFLRIFLFSLFSIPSESMLPRLWNGDVLVAQKWSYGYSSNSVPYGLPLIPGRFFASQPERGDVVIFKHPIDQSDYIKRVIALPGDTIAMRDGVVVLNGTDIPKQRIEDFIIPVSANTSCAWGAIQEEGAEGQDICRYARFRETLPSGKSYDVLDFGSVPKDNYGPIVVPADRMFVMGDNRDNSQDSRFRAAAGGGVGLVPQENLVGKAAAITWSYDGSGEWVMPWTWPSAFRWDRSAEGI